MSLSLNIIFIILFYLIGSIPFALLIPKLFGHGDIRKIGSGNVGATNVLRTGNKYLAFLVLCFDVLKGILPFIMLHVYSENIGLLQTIFLCHFSILGHIFPIWLKFKGGKGVATYIGFLFAINLVLGLFFLITWLTIALVTKYSSLSSLIASTIAPIYFIIKTDNYTAIFLMYLLAVIIVKHLENIKRLLNRTENKIKLSK
ncbi:MAG: acyl-phosphate glycerol 3-phosphate acyltransferase [Candidatus Marinimicrobia bacterium]|nr:acyl-phosphate glycerol 3-phosphate acyltransferase [Candidatus Neomarinimicrobiota bacterium]|tara:strand:+ start:1849 stop:2451 length:603 start_codon:yes stop_codon:yes gene_type:complete